MRILTVIHPNTMYRGYQVTKIVSTDWNFRGTFFPTSTFKGLTDFSQEVVHLLGRVDGIAELGLTKHEFSIGKADVFKWNELEPQILQIITETAKRFWPDEEIEMVVHDERPAYLKYQKDNPDPDWDDYTFLD